MKNLYLILLIFTFVFLACSKTDFQTNEKAEDKVIKLDTLNESPTGKKQDYQVGDEVSVIKADNVFEIECYIIRISSGKLVFTATYDRGRIAGKAWMPVEDAVNVPGDASTVPKGYYVRIGSGRSTQFEWCPPSRLFPPPWSNNVNLKVGNQVFERRFGDFESQKGIITELPAKGSSFMVRYDSGERAAIKPHDIFSSIEPAAVEKLSTGDIVYFDKMYWAMIIEKKEGNQVIIRQSGFPAEDKIVNVSKLQILR